LLRNKPITGFVVEPAPRRVESAISAEPVPVYSPRKRRSADSSAALTAFHQTGFWVNTNALRARRDQMPALRILVVEDEPLIGELFADLLVGMGHDVCAIAATETDAVAAAARLLPDLMIVDVRLGLGSGLTAVAEILRTRFIPHVFVSGDPSAVHDVRPDAVTLRKPFFASDLIRAIQRALCATPS
jgi:two-component system, response regulator PdtaR